MAVFSLKPETEFAGKSAAFFCAIKDRGSPSQIQSAKAEVISNLRAGPARLFEIQGFVNALLIVTHRATHHTARMEKTGFRAQRFFRSIPTGWSPALPQGP
jgi:uncharacterized membrane protein